MMRIAIGSDTFYPVMGGTEDVVNTLARKLTEKGHIVCVFTGDFGKKIDDNIFPYKVIRAHSTPLGFKQHLTNPNVNKKFKKELEKFKPDIVHVHTPHNVGRYMIKWANKYNIPSILTIHTRFNISYDIHAPFSNKNPIHKFIVNRLTDYPKNTAKLAKVITTVSQNSIDNEIKDKYGINNKRIELIRNGFDLNKLEVTFDPKEEDKYKNNLIMSFAGRIDETKNLIFSFKVCKILSLNKIPYKYFIAGEGKDKKRYETIIKKLGINDNIVFTGRLNSIQLTDLYNKSDVFLFPSIFDNDSIAAINSRLCGVPTICIKNTGTSERVTDGVNGYCLDNDENKFALKLIELYNLKTQNYSEFLKLKRNCINQKVESWDEITDRYLQLYKSFF